MIILIAIVAADLALLAGIVWSARPRPVPRARFAIARGDSQIPHAL
jgi:hypothetical protein